MTLLDLVVLLLIAGIAGTVGQTPAGYSLGGRVVSVGVSFAGAWIGRWLAIQVGGRSVPGVWSVAGSFPFALVVGPSTRRRMV